MDAIAGRSRWRRLWRSIFGGWAILLTATRDESGYFAGFRMSDLRVAEAQASPIPFRSARIFIDADALRA
jgi:hypothetical protein